MKAYYHQDLIRFYKSNIPPDSNVLNIYQGIDYFKQALKPKFYRSFDPELNQAIPKGRYDFIVISDTLSLTWDIQKLFHLIKQNAHSETRIIINYFNFMWLPILELAEKIGLKNPQQRKNWLNTEDFVNLLNLENFEVIKTGKRLLFPVYVPLFSKILNKYLANLPLFNNLCFTNYLIARPVDKSNGIQKSVSVVIPARNEAGNIESLVKRIPKLAQNTEIVFVEGHSTDGTWSEIIRVMKKYPNKKVKAFKQSGDGKADAVRKGFTNAHGEIFMILDADLSVPPEELKKFYTAICANKGEFVYGSRLVYPMEKQAMQFLNVVANYFFSSVFSWIINIKMKDTLCGTKVVSRNNYQKISKNRKFFGDFDPFGDFDLILGAAKLNLKFTEIPIHYKSRDYGKTNISRFQHGWLLIRMTLFALNKLKFN
jgi:hypothetical protein